MSAAKPTKTKTMAKTHSAAHGHEAHGHHEDHANHGSLTTYLIGFALSVFLTIVPFWLVMGRPLEGVFDSNVPVAFLLLAFAVVQMVVHMIFFLHMSPKSEGGWSLMALFFTLILVVIVMSGSMWVMYHMNTNMMPVHDMENMDTTGEGWLPSQQQPFPPAEGAEQPAPQPAVQPPAKQ